MKSTVCEVHRLGLGAAVAAKAVTWEETALQPGKPQVHMPREKCLRQEKQPGSPALLVEYEMCNRA